MVDIVSDFFLFIRLCLLAKIAKKLCNDNVCLFKYSRGRESNFLKFASRHVGSIYFRLSRLPILVHLCDV